MPVVDPATGEPVSDDPEQADENARGGEGKASFVTATEGPSAGEGVVSGPDNPRESSPGATQGEGPELSGPDSTGGV